MVAVNAKNLPEPRLDWALFLDFDGCIVDIAPTPESVYVPDRLPSLLVALREALGGAVAIVSGRPIAQIDGFLGTAVPAVAGLHGLERRAADGAIVRPLLPRTDLHIVRARLEAFAAAHPDVLVEDKKYNRRPALSSFTVAARRLQGSPERRPQRHSAGLAGHRRQIRLRNQTA